MVRFLFLRHGYSVTNKSQTFTGQLDAPLDAIGFAQAERAAEYIAANYHIDAIYSSDLCRAMDTARPLAERLQLAIREDEGFREIDVGEWMGVAYEKIHPTEDYKRLAADAWQVPYSKTGESMRQVAVRATAALSRIAKAHEGETVLIALHGGTLKALLYAWQGAKGPMESIPVVSNASVTVVEYADGQATVTLLGEAGYLQDLKTDYFAAH